MKIIIVTEDTIEGRAVAETVAEALIAIHNIHDAEVVVTKPIGRSDCPCCGASGEHD